MQNQLEQPLIGEAASNPRLECYSECDSNHSENLIYFNKSAPPKKKSKDWINEVHQKTLDEASNKNEAQIIVDAIEYEYKMD